MEVIVLLHTQTAAYDVPNIGTMTRRLVFGKVTI